MLFIYTKAFQNTILQLDKQDEVKSYFGLGLKHVIFTFFNKG